MDQRNTLPDERIFVLMPNERDADRTAHLLAGANLACVQFRTLLELCEEQARGVGALLITDEILAADLEHTLERTLRQQPAWSAVPILLLARDGVKAERGFIGGYNHTVVLERPVRPLSLVSAASSALRARRNQYEIRDAIAERERQARELSEQDERLRFALAAGRLGSWQLDLKTHVYSCSDIDKANYGRSSAEALTFEERVASVYPSDRERVRVAFEDSIANQSPYDVEHRVVWPNGETHWLMVRGRAVYDAAGNAIRMAGVSLDITERKQLEEALLQSEAELAIQAEQLRKADRLKDEFLATLAHELRNPLAPIRTGLSLLCDTPTSDVSQRTLGIMQRQVGHMVRLIDDLLDVSRITQGKLELRRERISLASAVGAAIEASMPAIQQAQHAFQTNLGEEALFVDADSTRLAQVIGNLLHNASKYTPNNGNISLTVRREGSSVAIVVSDDGMGLPPECLEQVFKMFNQVDQSLHRAQGGLGIGLALVRTLVELHGGTVEAESSGLNLGSTFTVRLPLAASEPSAVTPPARHNRSAAARKRILVVDDNTDAAELLALMLEGAGYLTTAVADGPAAIEAAHRLTPEFVILDIGLPGMNGYEVAQVLRQDTALMGTSLIALTGWGTPEDQRKAAAAGFDLHLTKPVSQEDVHAALALAASKRKRLDDCGGGRQQ